MDQFNSFGTTVIWVGIISAVFSAICLYFTLTYFEHLKKEDDHLIRQSKLFAVTSLVLALIIPFIYQLYTIYRIMSINQF